MVEASGGSLYNKDGEEIFLHDAPQPVVVEDINKRGPRAETTKTEQLDITAETACNDLLLRSMLMSPIGNDVEQNDRQRYEIAQEVKSVRNLLKPQNLYDPEVDTLRREIILEEIQRAETIYNVDTRIGSRFVADVETFGQDPHLVKSMLYRRDLRRSLPGPPSAAPVQPSPYSKPEQSSTEGAGTQAGFFSRIFIAGSNVFKISAIVAASVTALTGVPDFASWVSNTVSGLAHRAGVNHKWIANLTRPKGRVAITQDQITDLSLQNPAQSEGIDWLEIISSGHFGETINKFFSSISQSTLDIISSMPEGDTILKALLGLAGTVVPAVGLHFALTQVQDISERVLKIKHTKLSHALTLLKNMAVTSFGAYVAKGVSIGLGAVNTYSEGIQSGVELTDKFIPGDTHSAVLVFSVALALSFMEKRDELKITMNKIQPKMYRYASVLAMFAMLHFVFLLSPVALRAVPEHLTSAHCAAYEEKIKTRIEEYQDPEHQDIAEQKLAHAQEQEHLPEVITSTNEITTTQESPTSTPASIQATAPIQVTNDITPNPIMEKGASIEAVIVNLLNGKSFVLPKGALITMEGVSYITEEGKVAIAITVEQQVYAAYYSNSYGNINVNVQGPDFSEEEMNRGVLVYIRDSVNGDHLGITAHSSGTVEQYWENVKNSGAAFLGDMLYYEAEAEAENFIESFVVELEDGTLVVFKSLHQTPDETSAHSEDVNMDFITATDSSGNPVENISNIRPGASYIKMPKIKIDLEILKERFDEVHITYIQYGDGESRVEHTKHTKRYWVPKPEFADLAHFSSFYTGNGGFFVLEYEPGSSPRAVFFGSIGAVSAELVALESYAISLLIEAVTGDSVAFFNTCAPDDHVSYDTWRTAYFSQYIIEDLEDP